MNQFRLLTADEIECRVKKVTAKGAIILLYKTARTDMDMLDETVGAENWEADYKVIKDNLYCGIGIRCGDHSVWKWDCGIESREDDEGNQKKGEASDAFKRAGFKWGIGRELYSSPFIFVKSIDIDIKENNGRFLTYDTFSVDKISYDAKRRIVGLSIKNDKTHSTAFTWGDVAPTKSSLSSSNPSASCSSCSKVIVATKKKDGEVWSAEDIAMYTERRFGRVLCPECMKSAFKSESA